jgi:hypothetical protein
MVLSAIAGLFCGGSVDDRSRRGGRCTKSRRARDSGDADWFILRVSQHREWSRLYRTFDGSDEVRCGWHLVNRELVRKLVLNEPFLGI